MIHCWAQESVFFGLHLEDVGLIAEGICSVGYCLCIGCGGGWLTFARALNGRSILLRGIAGAKVPTGSVPTELQEVVKLGPGCVHAYFDADVSSLDIQGSVWHCGRNISHVVDDYHCYLCSLQRTRGWQFRNTGGHACELGMCIDLATWMYPGVYGIWRHDIVCESAGSAHPMLDNLLVRCVALKGCCAGMGV
jgi:hypothetical protein